MREELSRRIANTIQELRSVKERQQINKVNNAERLAQVEARRKSLEQMSLEENRLTELIDQCRALLVQAVHGDDNAYDQAESVANEAINLRPGNGPATQARVTAIAGNNINRAYRLRNLRADRLLETLYLVELSDVCFPDEPPIQWPNAQVWRALTERRKKWAQVDLRSESKPEQRISEALDQQVDFNIEPQSLKDAIDFIQARYQIPIVIDQKALDDANVDTTTEVKGSYPGIKLRNLFKLLLEQLSAPLTYVIEDEVLKITTVDKANEKLSIRMYPVGDLIMGPQQLRALAGSGGRRGRWPTWRAGRRWPRRRRGRRWPRWWRRRPRRRWRNVQRAQRTAACHRQQAIGPLRLRGASAGAAAGDQSRKRRDRFTAEVFLGSDSIRAKFLER